MGLVLRLKGFNLGNDAQLILNSGFFKQDMFSLGGGLCSPSAVI